MPAWDIGPFANDLAAAWVREFLANPGPDVLRDTLDLVAAAADDDELSLDACTRAIAAAEVVAALLRRRHPDLPDSIAAWVAARPVAEPPDRRLIEKAARTATRVRDRSHLRTLWSDPEDLEAWHAELESLASRLTS
ncbi:MAG: DUF4259 domain-containing protein [Phycisphaerales bacterium]